MANDPYISVVVTARNDNHGENMLGRMEASLGSWIRQAERYGIPSEIVIVEWNPPAGRPPLKDALRWPSSTGPCAVRFVQVPPEVHASIPHADIIHLHQMIGKNVGIRRARAPFVLATNIDIIYSAKLMQFFADRRLEDGAFYRIDRYDVAKNIPPDARIDQLLAFCRSHTLRVSAREGTWNTNGDNIRPVEAKDILPADSGIRFGAGWFGIEKYEATIKRYLGPEADIVFARPYPAPMLFEVEAGQSAQEGKIELALLDESGVEQTSVIVDGWASLRLDIPAHLQTGRFRLTTRHGDVPLVEDPRMLNLRALRIGWGEREDAPHDGWRWTVLKQRPSKLWPGAAVPSPYASLMRNPAFLHINACGDFTLLSRRDWFRLRAYPELPIWPMHIDSLFCFAAYHGGVREIILLDPLRIFHIEHGNAQGSTPEGEKALQDRVRAKGIPIIEYSSLVQYFHNMRRFNLPVIFSRENWGLGNHTLPESVL